MRITQPSGEEGCLLQRQEAVNLIGLFPLPIAKDAVNKGIHAGCFCRQMVNNMEGLLGWQEENLVRSVGEMPFRRGRCSQLAKSAEDAR